MFTRFASLLGPPLALQPGHDRFYAPQTSTGYDAMIKDRYHSRAMLNTLNEENAALDKMEEVEGQSTSGRQHIIPKLVGRNYSAGSIPKRGALPQAGRLKFEDSKITVRNVVVRCGIDEWVEQESRDNKGAFEKVWATETEGAVAAVAFQRNRMAWGTGLGVVAKVNGVHSGVTTIELKDPGGVAGTFMANRFLQGDSQDGQFIHFLDSATPTNIKGYGTINAVNVDGTDITVDQAQTLADGDLVVLGQTPTQNSYNVEPEGILCGVDDGTFVSNHHDISRTTYALEKAHVVTGVGPISFDAIQQGDDAVSIKKGGATEGYACQHDVARAILALTDPDRRYSGVDLMKPDGGTKRMKKPGGTGGMVIGGKEVLVERDAPYGMFFGMRWSDWLRLTWPNTGWNDKGGGILKWVEGFLQYTAFWHLFENYHCTDPSGSFRLEGITVTQVAARPF